MFMHMLSSDPGTEADLLCAQHTGGAGKLWRSKLQEHAVGTVVEERWLGVPG